VTSQHRNRLTSTSHSVIPTESLALSEVEWVEESLDVKKSKS
jgi:hypothetical protein